ncbi:MAG: hypothetical protein RSB77_06270 [Bacilli bacterium]
MDFDFNLFNIDFDDEKKKEKLVENQKPEKTKSRGRVTLNKHLFKRFASERALEETIGWTAVKGECYHVISMGDIDSLTYLKWVLRQQTINKLMISTWCLSLLDLEEIKRYLDLGIIKKLDFYVGEIFPNSYSKEYELLKEIMKTNEGRVAVFRNHSKIYAGYGEKFNFVIESSANINTNPRTEQTVITIDDELVDFYFEFFDNIISFDKENRGK